MVPIVRDEQLRAASSSHKRKQPDPDEILAKEGPLSEEPIENEYEHLDDDNDVDEDTDGKVAGELAGEEYEQILKAAEPETIVHDGDIKITPFNLEEELEEGQFDRAGHYILKTRKDESDEDEEGGGDNWADSVDWSAVEKRERERNKNETPAVAQTSAKHSNPTGDLPATARDRISCYKNMLRIMRPDETVQRAIRRLGNSVPKRRFNKPSRKSEVPKDSEDDPDQVAAAKQSLNRMIELAHHVLEDGDTDIYQKSYEDLEEAIN